jgi:hypothetical protein
MERSEIQGGLVARHVRAFITREDGRKSPFMPGYGRA